MTYELNKEKFLKEVSDHDLIILKDDGLYRHIRFKEPNTMMQYFDIVTWPGYLAYSGDMGSYTFSRIEDMFSFFRDESDTWGINPGYWSEKLEAVCRTDGYKEFSWDAFVENLMDYCDTDEQKEFIRSELEYVESDEFGAVSFIREFDNDNEAGVDISDFWECSHDVPATRFLWCCYALVWGIRKYDDAMKQGAAA